MLFYEINYNNIKNEIEKVININKNYEFIFNKNNNKYNIVEIYLKNKLLIKAEFYTIGLYNLNLSIWYWSWDIDFINKELVKPIENIKGAMNDININQLDNKLKQEIYFYISNNNFYISNENISKLVKIVLYITKTLWYFPIKLPNDDKIQYIVISKIIQHG